MSGSGRRTATPVEVYAPRLLEAALCALLRRERLRPWPHAWWDHLPPEIGRRVLVAAPAGNVTRAAELRRIVDTRITPDRVVLVTTSATPLAEVAQITSWGVQVIIGMEDAPAELSRGVYSALEREPYTGKTIAALVEEVRRSAGALVPRQNVPLIADEKGDVLSSRQREVAVLAVAGLTNGEIAARLFIDVSTVKSHMGSIYRKLGIRKRGQLIVHARRVMADLL